MLGEWNLRQLWKITSGIYAKYHVQTMPLFVYTPTSNSVVIFTCRYFKLSWKTTALSQSNCRNFSCSSIIPETAPAICGQGDVGAGVVEIVVVGIVVGKSGGEQKEKWYENNQSFF